MSLLLKYRWNYLHQRLLWAHDNEDTFMGLNLNYLGPQKKFVNVDNFFIFFTSVSFKKFVFDFFSLIVITSWNRLTMFLKRECRELDLGLRLRFGEGLGEDWRQLPSQVFPKEGIPQKQWWLTVTKILMNLWWRAGFSMVKYIALLSTFSCSLVKGAHHSE